MLTSLVDTANALVNDYTAISDDMVSYSSSLTATSVVLEGINAFITTARGHIDVQFTKFSEKKFVEKLVRYILSFGTTTSLVLYISVSFCSIKTLYESGRNVVLYYLNNTAKSHSSFTIEKITKNNDYSKIGKVHISNVPNVSIFFLFLKF